MITSTLMEITPKMASQLLLQNTANRPLNKRHAARIAAAIVRGEWKVNGDTIRIASDGTVLDGQHRLDAIVISNQAVKSLFVTGLDRSVFDTIDVGGQSRTTSHVLAIRGDSSYTTLASAARIALIRENCGDPFNASSDAAPTTAQIVEFIDANLDIKKSAYFVANSRWVKRNISPSIGAMCHFVFTRQYPEKTAEFFEQLETGEGLYSGSAVLLLRDRLSDSRGGIEKLENSYKTALIFKAFKHFLAGDSLRTLRVRLDGASPEKNIYSL